MWGSAGFAPRLSRLGVGTPSEGPFATPVCQLGVCSWSLTAALQAPRRSRIKLDLCSKF